MPKKFDAPNADTKHLDSKSMSELLYLERLVREAIERKK